MISYPKLKAKAPYRQKLDKFRGYNHNLRIGSGEFYEMENLTSDDYPVLSVRGRRSSTSIRFDGDCLGMYYVPGVGLFHIQEHDGNGKGSLLLLKPSGEDVLVHYYWVSTEPKQFALIGKTLVIVPDMKGIDIDSLGTVQLGKTLAINSGTLRISPCLADGTLLENGYRSPNPPEDPLKYSHWVDCATYPEQVKRYSTVEEEWVGIDTAYVCLKGEGLEGHPFQEGDGIHISGIGASQGSNTHSYDNLIALNGCHVVVRNPSSDAIIIKGIMTTNFTNPCDQHHVSMEQKIPDMDFLVECGNRLWGCKRDTNEIYACKLGDPYNWNCFQELSTDSWVGSIGTPGEFTGAVVQNGYPVFYKENCKHKVWPSATGAHQITTTPCNGVEKGSENSIAVLDGTVFYKSAFGVFADDGGGSVEIGQALGDLKCKNASAAILNRKYYLNTGTETGEFHLFVYDIDRKMWHREAFFDSHCLVSGGSSLFAASGNQLWDLTGNTGTSEEDVSWFAVTGDLGLELPEQKYISRLTLRLSLDPGATLEVYAQYDREQTWVKLGQVYGTDLRSFSLPVRPRRCDQLRLKLQGTGMCKLYSIAKTLEKGSELT